MKRNLLLTPECQDLWVLSPSMLFNYNKIVIDIDDFNNIINPEIDTKLRITKSLIMKKLKSLGLVEIVSYKSLLNEQKRKNIHIKADQYIDSLLKEASSNFKSSKFYKLCLFTHIEYQTYLQNCIMACSIEDERRKGVRSQHLT